MSLASINPATGKTIRTYAEHDDAQIEERLRRARDTFASYRFTPLAERSDRLLAAAKILEDEKHAFARLMTEEMGKTLRSAVAEVEKCAWACRHYAEHAAGYIADETVETDAQGSFLRYLPIGPVLAIMPWNFPFWQVVRFAAPALMAGNVGLLKHASNVSGCALALEDLFLRAGFPEGAFQTLLVGSNRVTEVIEDPRVKAVTLTGSEGAGVAVAVAAGRQLKKVVLELGGSDPFIVMPSADVEKAAAVAVTARTINNGQSCIAAKRFIVHESVYDRFEALFLDGLERLRQGDPTQDDVDLGPLAKRDLVETVDAQVRDSMALGARLLCGGTPGEGPGNFYPATALTDIPTDSPVYREEVFGPVALLFKVDDIDEAIRLANDSDYGLGSSVWTTDPSEQERFIDEIEAGQTFVNAMVASDPRLPFGGVKHSGHGRELGALGIRAFMNIKSVSVGEGSSGAHARSE